MADELADVARPHEHGIEAGPLEGQGLAPGHHVDVGDRELPGRDVRQQLEHRLECVLVVVALVRREQEDLRVVLLERGFELLLGANVHHGLDLVRALRSGPDRDRIRVVWRALAEPEQRQRGRLADAGDRPIDGQGLRALLLGRPR